MCFGVDDRRIGFKPIKAVIRHPLEEKLFAVRTAYGRNVRVTSSHSVFVHEDGALRLKRGDELRIGDALVAPRTLRLPETAPSRIDLLRELHKDRAAADRSGSAARPSRMVPQPGARPARRFATLTAPRIDIPDSVRAQLAARRRASGLESRPVPRDRRAAAGRRSTPGKRPAAPDGRAFHRLPEGRRRRCRRNPAAGPRLFRRP
jgi:DNA gyrase subunit B